MTDADKIRNTIARYSQALDERRFDEFAGLFVPEGRFGPRNGREEIRAWIKGAELATKPELRRKHAVVNVVVEVNGGRARAISDLMMYDKVGDRPWVIVRIGRYTDDLMRCEDGEWRFVQRVLDWAD